MEEKIADDIGGFAWGEITRRVFTPG